MDRRRHAISKSDMPGSSMVERGTVNAVRGSSTLPPAAKTASPVRLVTAGPLSPVGQAIAPLPTSRRASGGVIAELPSAATASCSPQACGGQRRCALGRPRGAVDLARISGGRVCSPPSSAYRV